MTINRQTLVQQVQALTRQYVRKGGKKNRLQQEKRMLAFAKFCGDVMKAPNLQAVGKRHVIAYYKAKLHLSDATRQSHYYALRSLFFMAGKAEPPRPFLKQKPDETSRSVE